MKQRRICKINQYIADKQYFFYIFLWSCGPRRHRNGTQRHSVDKRLPTPVLLPRLLWSCHQEMPTTICLVKKCALRSLPSAVASISTNAFFLLDTLTGLHFLIDIGACRSLPPKSKVYSGCSPGTDNHLVAANRSHILMYGYKSLRLSFAGITYKWDFIVADVSISIIGTDLLANFNLLLDVANRRLVNTSALASTSVAAVPAGLALQIADVSGAYSSLKSSYPEVFHPVLHLTPRTPADHCIKTSGPPVFSKFHRLAPDKLQATKKVFHDMEAMGICQMASSPWSSPLHIVAKKDCSLRPCGDYRRLSKMTEPDHYPLPNIVDITTYLHGAKIFSKLDLLKGYYQVPMHPDDIPKTVPTPSTNPVLAFVMLVLPFSR